MFTKLHKQLLERWPLLWNMRFFTVLPILAAVHLFHFAVGWSQYSGKQGREYFSSPGDLFFSSSFALFSIAASCAVFVLWLIRVFRNNAFKSFYPVRAGGLYAQFLIILLVCLGNVSYYFSYAKGYVSHMKADKISMNEKQATELYNRLSGLMLGSKQSYAVDFRCGDAPFPLHKFVKQNRQSVPQTALAREDYYYQSNDGHVFSLEQVDSMTGGVEFSYLNNCNTYTFTGEANGIPGGIQAAVLSDSARLRREMQEFIDLLQKEKIDHNVSAEQWFAEVWNPPYFPVKEPVSMDRGTASRFIDGYSLQNRLTLAHRIERFDYDFPVFCGFCYAALVAALLIFTFRVTSARAWLISVVGANILSLLIGALSVLFGLAGAVGSLLTFYALLIPGFFVVHLLAGKKNWSGAALNWFTYSLPYYSLIMLGFNQYSYSGRSVAVHSGFYYWTHDRPAEYFFFCWCLYIVLFGLIITPSYKRWQARPDS